jgi:hypothetical protein
MTPQSLWGNWDQHDNETGRLPEGEEVHLGGLVLSECFTPSTISALYKGLEDFPGERDKKQEWIAHLTRGRSAAGTGGWLNLGLVRRVSEPPALFTTTVDPELPEGVEAAWCYVHFLTPSLTLIVVTFTLADQAGDLSALLRADYKTEAEDLRFKVLGPLGRVRTHIPWARPTRHSASISIRRAGYQKKLACDSVIEGYEKACWDWFAKRFPGRFRAEARAVRPTVRILLTKDQVPYTGDPESLAAVGLTSAWDAWRSTDLPGWSFKFDGSPDRRFRATAAARRQDAARSPGGGISGDTAWYLTARFADEQSSLVARWATTCLLSLYADQLAGLRDRAGTPRRLGRPVRDARDLDMYLMRNGLDGLTVISDLEEYTEDLTRFRRDVPEYEEALDAYPLAIRKKRQAAKLIPLMRERMQNQARRLERDMDVTTKNISISAELRQAIANTTVQRRLLVLTVIAITIAVIGLIIALHAHTSTTGKGGGHRPRGQAVVTKAVGVKRIHQSTPRSGVFWTIHLNL